MMQQQMPMIKFVLFLFFVEISKSKFRPDQKFKVSDTAVRVAELESQLETAKKENEEALAIVAQVSLFFCLLQIQ